MSSQIVIILTIVSATNQTNLTLISNCVYTILEKYYKAPWTVMTVDTNLQLLYPTIYQNSTNRNFIKVTHRLPNIYIITENKNLSKILDQLLKIEMYNPEANFIIISVFYSQNIFKILSEFFVSKEVVITSNCDLITYDPFIWEDALASGVKPTNLGKCTNFDFSINIFNKTFPYYWRNTTLFTTFIQHYPYIFLKDNTLTGQFHDILDVVKEKLQFRLSLQEFQLHNGPSETVLSIFNNFY